MRVGPSAAIGCGSCCPRLPSRFCRIATSISVGNVATGAGTLSAAAWARADVDRCGPLLHTSNGTPMARATSYFDLKRKFAGLSRVALAWPPFRLVVVKPPGGDLDYGPRLGRIRAGRAVGEDSDQSLFPISRRARTSRISGSPPAGRLGRRAFVGDQAGTARLVGTVKELQLPADLCRAHKLALTWTRSGTPD